MKRLFLVSLAIVLVMSLGIAMFPIQSVEAGQDGGRVFNITAKGQGDYTIRIYPSPPTNGTGEFSISVHGQAKSKQPLGHGYGYPPQAEVGGHISGSFDGHKINVGLQGNQVEFDCSHLGHPLNLIHVFGLRLRGNYDGNAIKTGGSNHVWVYGDEGSRTIEALLYHADIGGYLYIYVSEATADTFKVNIHEVGN